MLPGCSKVESRPVSFDRLYTLTDTHEALVYACELARLQPKQVAPLVGVDKTVWSRICSGEFDLDGRDVRPFCAAVNNDAYLMYLNHVQGYDLATLRKQQTPLEKENEDLRQENHDLRRLLALKYDVQKEGR